jgi:hypothetical protein
MFVAMAGVYHESSLVGFYGWDYSAMQDDGALSVTRPQLHFHRPQWKYSSSCDTLVSFDRVRVDPDVYRSNWAFNAKHSLSLPASRLLPSCPSLFPSTSGYSLER